MTEETLQIPNKFFPCDPGAGDVGSDGPRGCQVLAFEIDGQRYALPVENVVEVLRSMASAPLPKAPQIVEGVIDLRGKVIAVLDVRSRFRHKRRPPAHTDHVIVAGIEGRTLAFRVDAATEILTIPRHDMRDACQVSPGVGYISDVARWANSLILIHDPATFLSRVEQGELEQALDNAQGAHP